MNGVIDDRYFIASFRFVKKRKTVKPEDKIAPDIQIVGPALEYVKYCIGNKALREMFSNLVVATVDKNMVNYIHPMFPWILSKMSSTDAKILSTVRGCHMDPIFFIILRVEKLRYLSIF